MKASSGYAKYIWNRSDTTQSIVVNRSGYYTVSVQDVAGNLLTSDEVEVVVVSKPTEPTIVQIDSNSLQTTSADFYQWYKGSVLLPGATKQILDIATLGAGSYHVVVSNKKGCKNISKDYLIAMKLTFLGSLEFCAGDSVTIQAASGYKRYYWSNGFTNQAITVKTGGRFSAIGIDTFGDTARSNEFTIKVFPTPPRPTLTKTGNTLTSSRAVLYQWYYKGVSLPDETKKEIDANKYGLGSYKVSIVDSNGCKNISDSLTISSTFDDFGSGIESFIPLSIQIQQTSEKLSITDDNNDFELCSYIIYNILGNVVASGVLEEGSSEKNINISRYVSGIYYVQLHSRNKVLTKQFAVVR